MIRYTISGISFLSNIPLPYLLPAVSYESYLNFPISISLGSFPPQFDKSSGILLKSRSTQFENSSLIRCIKDEFFWFCYQDKTEFLISNKGDQIWAVWPPELSLENTVTYLLGQVLGFVLRLHGIVSLHGCAVEVDQETLIFIGRNGAGKSTTLATFAKIGYPVLADNLSALTEENGQFYVQPAYPYIRLWSDSVKSLFGTQDALPRIIPDHPDWDKRFLNLNQPNYCFAKKAKPLAGIYWFDERSSNLRTSLIENLDNSTALITLIANSYPAELLDKRMRSHEFQVLGRLVQKIPVRRVVARDSLKELPGLCEDILADFWQKSRNGTRK